MKLPLLQASDAGMPASFPIRICTDCEPWLVAAATAMRRHAREMHTSLYLLRKGDAAYDEQQREVSGWLVQSLQEAQSAWDAYREHLQEHGLNEQVNTNKKLTGT